MREELILLLSGGLVIVSLLALLLLLRGRRLRRAAAEARAELERTRPQQRVSYLAMDDVYRAKRMRGRAADALLRFVLLLLLGGAVLGYALFDWSRFGFGQEWPLAIASVRESQAQQLVTSQGGGFNLRYRLHAVYAYTTENGQTFTRTVTNESATQTERDAFVQRYAVGELVPVYYHPLFPQIAFNTPTGPIYIYGLLGVGFVLILLALWQLSTSLALYGQARQMNR